MLNENFVILGAIINAIGSLSYLIDTIKGKIKPNKITYLLWSLIPFIAFTAEIKQGVGIQSLTTFMVGFTPLLIFLASFINRQSEWKLGKLDFICGTLSLFGLILWNITRVGDIAIIFSILADALAAIPTIVKSYYYPETENGWIYLGGGIAAVLTIFTITNWNFAHYGFPVYIVLLSITLVLCIQFKLRKRLSKLL